MNWQLEEAKDGNLTVKMNSHYLYSKYYPYKDASKWIHSEVDSKASAYCLIGLGLGYHLKALLELGINQPIYVYYFEKVEYDLFLACNEDRWWDIPQVNIVHDLQGIDLEGDMQLLIPNSIIKAIGTNHPLHSILEVIKINKASYQKVAATMEINFFENIKRENGFLKIHQDSQKRIACLVAAGPSLNETVSWLTNHQQNLDIYVVGAALKVLLQHNIVPKAVVLSDASEETMHQFDGVEYNGDLYYLSTANHKTIDMHQGKRIILLQKGYPLAERFAKEHSLPLIETGGSVGTTTFSLIELLNYSTVFLFGQDLGFYGYSTHAEGSPSKKVMEETLFLRTIEANDKSEIYTTAMFYSFWYWYKEKMKETSLNVYNTALKGAKIPNIPYINCEEFEKKINNSIVI